MAGRLSVVSTPIGNLEDITLRALRVLSEAHVILCEDTRVTRKLLSHYNITTPTLSFHAHSGAAKVKRVIELLTEGKHIALVSDAGTPGVSDPGPELVSVVRDTFDDEVVIEAIPGASALAAALSISGMKVPSFTFYGFLPQKKGRETIFKEMAANDRASVFYESPHRFMKALQSLGEHLSDGRRVGVFRELTKMHEEAVIGTPAFVVGYYEEHEEKKRGEVVVVVEGL